MVELPRMLVVDDEPDMLEFLERVFRRDYQVVCAAGAVEAEAHLASGSFAVILSDRRMPKKSGLLLLKESRALHPDAVRVLLTGYADPLEEGADAAAGVDAWVTKPIDSTALRELVAGALLRRRGG